MKKLVIGATLPLMLCLFLPAHASSGAWWVFCGVCETPAQFRNAALETPGGDRVYFVSNPDTLGSRKFEKWSTYEEFSDGIVRRTRVNDLHLSAREADGLHSALESASTLSTVIGREDVGESVGSVADDISS